MAGLMSGIIRGGLDTATDIIQTGLQQGQKNIEDDVKGFGAKFKDYKDKQSVFEAESATIKETAAALAAQDDEFLKNLSPSQLEGVAQTLLTYSGQKTTASAMEFFTKNRDKLNVKPVQPTTETAVTPTDAQTTAAMEQPASAPATTDDRSFLEVVFGGMPAEKRKSEVAKRLGISVEEYDTVMAGKVPTRAPSTMQIGIGQDDKYEKIIDGRQEKVLSAISQQAFLRMENIEMPDGTKVTGKAFANSMLRAYEDYKVHGGDGAALAKMQNFALTLTMPPDLKDFFKNHHGKAIDDISAGVSNSAIPQKQRERLATISQELTDHMFNAVSVPGYATQEGNASKVQALVIEGRKLLASEVKDGKTKPYDVEIIEKSIDNILTRANSTSSTAPQLKPEYAEQVFGLRSKLVEARNSEDPVAAIKALADEVRDLSVSAFTAAPNTPNATEVKLTNTINMLRDMPRFKNKSDEELTEIAGKYLALNPNGPQKDKAGRVFVIMPTPNGPVSVPVGTETGEGYVASLTPDQEVEYRTKIKDNSRSLNLYAELTDTVAENPLVYTAFGKMAVRGATYADIAGELTGTNIGQAYSRYFNIPQNAEAQRRAIELVGTAKDRLFDDPRLSDQDLRLVLQYIAVIEQGGLGTGATQSIAALQGLQMALLKDTASRMYSLSGNKMPVLPKATRAGGELDFYDDNGQFIDKDALASRLFLQTASAYKFNVQPLSVVANMPANEQQLYLAKHDMIQNMVESALHDIVTYEALGVDRLTAPSNLMSMGEVNNGIMNIDGTDYRVQALEDVKRSRGI